MPRMRRVTNRGGVREGAGRPRDGSSERTDQRRSQEVLRIMGGYTYDEVAKAFINFTADERGDVFADLVEAAIYKMVNRRRILLDEEESIEMIDKLAVVKPEKLDKTAGLSILLHQSLSKRQYIGIRKAVNSASRTQILPSYNQVFRAKSQCRPSDGIEITEVKATVKLQNLIEHTIDRILELVGDRTDEVIRSHNPRRKRRSCTLVFSYGMDGASGYRNYKQSYRNQANMNRSDSDRTSMFAAVLNPLLLKEDTGAIIWRNEVPQSPLFVRPLLIESKAESKELVKRYDGNSATKS